ncbi:MAG TPA: alpha/beta hydrolase [Candidatus Eisenbacteria bacterium]|nr:alpha/beta hydrolase [Candidatus Eisenbacteria bacterium]
MTADSASTPAAHWPRRILAGVVLVILVTAISGYIYENVSEARDRRFNPMSGHLVEVNGHKMHILCAGKGSPTVVLDSGMGDSYLSWRKVQPQIAGFTRVCSYDRAGLGYSEPSGEPRTSKVIAAELHGLLHADGIAPPYVLVGHSMAGFDVRLYASAYPGEVAGMVLVDASHPDQENRFSEDLKAMEGNWLRDQEFIAYTMPFGVPRLLGLCEDDPVERAAGCNSNSAREQVAEMKAFNESAAQTATTGSLGDMPLAVISHDPEKLHSELPPDIARSTNQAWATMQEELAHLSTRGTQTVSKSSSHYIQFDNPELVISTVRNIVEQVRNSQQPPAPSATR